MIRMVGLGSDSGGGWGLFMRWGGATAGYGEGY